MPKSIRWIGWALALALIALGLLARPASAEINPWALSVAESAASPSAATPRAGRGRLARLHDAGHALRWRDRTHLPAPAGILRGVAPEMAAKAREIVSACGSRVISGVRHTRVAGTRRMSLHASGRAVDMAGNPGCIYARLRGWPGGYSTDYARVRHVHISGPGGREDGLRFAHRHFARRVRLAAR